MLHVLNQNYEKILKKIPSQMGDKAWKTALYTILIICWATIIIGTFLLLK